MKLTVNGVEHELASAPLTPLLHVLRDELDVTSPKAGCQQGGCGTCTVLIDAATALLERKGGPVERDEALEALGGHYCRCTGYVKIVDAVLAASRGQVGTVPDLPEPEQGEPDVIVKGSPA